MIALSGARITGRQESSRPVPKVSVLSEPEVDSPMGCFRRGSFGKRDDPQNSRIWGEKRDGQPPSGSWVNEFESFSVAGIGIRAAKNRSRVCLI